MGLACIIFSSILFGLTFLGWLGIGIGVCYIGLSIWAFNIALGGKDYLACTDSIDDLFDIDLSEKIEELKEECSNTYTKLFTWLYFDVLKLKVEQEPEAEPQQKPPITVGAKYSAITRNPSWGLQFWESIRLTPPLSKSDVRDVNEKGAPNAQP